jgi:tripartite-type tricarboxylate transporter receptor subunit TctC
VSIVLLSNRRTLLRLGAAATCGALLLPERSRAEGDYPDHVIRLIVPRPAGGVVDIIAREWGDKIHKVLGATYVENMGGGGGTIGAGFAARAPADGYTLLFGTTSELVLSPFTSHQSYDPMTSFEPISIICESVAAIVVNPKIPAADLAGLVAYAKKNPGQLNYGSAGVGTVSNLAGELFKREAALPDITHIPYRGGSEAMSDLIADHIPIMTPMMSQTIIELHRQGRIRVLAVASEHRLDAMPDIATAAEQGFPELIARLFVGLFAPAATPQPIVAQIDAATHVAMQDPDLQKNFSAAGFESVTDSDAASAARYVEGEITRWKPILQQVNLNPN